MPILLLQRLSYSEVTFLKSFNQSQIIEIQRQKKVHVSLALDSIFQFMFNSFGAPISLHLQDFTFELKQNYIKKGKVNSTQP